MASDDLIKKLDTLQEEGKFQEVFDTVTAAVKDDASNIELLWRTSRAFYDMAESKEDKTWQQDYFTKSLDYAKKALEADANHFGGHKWFAISSSAVGQFLAAKDKIGNAFKIKEEALRAVELRPGDATTLHLLGRWCHSVASISWVERKVASALFATPPESSFDEALAFFLRAAEANPNFIRNALYTADTYVQLKKQAEAKAWYQKAGEMKATTDAEKRMQDEAKTKLSKL